LSREAGGREEEDQPMTNEKNDKNRSLSPSLPVSLSSGLPPGPREWLPGRLFLAFLRDANSFLMRLAREYGDIVHTRFGHQHIALLNHPDHIQDVLVAHHRNFVKTNEQNKLVIGNSLLPSEGDRHRQLRHLMQPSFNRDHVAVYAPVLVEHATRLRERWQEGARVDIGDEMMHLTQTIAGKALLDSDVEADSAAITEALSLAIQSMRIVHRLPGGRLLAKLPLPANRRFEQARDRLHAIVEHMMAEHRARASPKVNRGDVLSLLLRIQQEEGPGGIMTDEQVRDEALGLFAAGHETMASALTWTWYLLSQHSEVEARFHAELDAVLQGRLPSAADVSQLVYTEKVFREAMRVYTPVSLMARRAVADYAVGGYSLPAGTIVLLSQHVTHHDPRWFPDPLRFDPDRWTAEFRRALPRFAYFPFGGGERQCIGEPFAWLEGVLLLATLGQRWRLRAVPGHPVVPRQMMVLKPRYGLPMIVARR
jgi:cytochrome P450